MKKIAVLAAVLALILAFGGCASSDTIDNDQIARRQTLVKSYLDGNRIVYKRITYVGQIKVNGGSFSEQLSYVEEGSTQPVVKPKDVRVIDNAAVENDLYVFHVQISAANKATVLLAADAESGSVYRKYTDTDGNEVYLRVSPALSEDYINGQVSLPSATPLPTAEATATDGAGEQTGGADSEIEETPAAE